jgi:hypothetical protein
MADDVPMADAAPVTSSSASRRGTDLAKLEADVQVQLQAAAQVRVLGENAAATAQRGGASHPGLRLTPPVPPRLCVCGLAWRQGRLTDAVEALLGLEKTQRLVRLARRPWQSAVDAR